jgi:hypothetical protein
MKDMNAEAIKQLYNESNDLFNNLDSALRSFSNELNNVGYDKRHKHLGKLQEACESVGNARSIIDGVRRTIEAVSN